MWQRKQTLFLALSALALILLLFFPVWLSTQATTRYVLSALYFDIAQNDIHQKIFYPYCLTLILAVASATVSLSSIRRYDNRILQIKLGTFNSLLIAGTMISAVYFATNLIQQYGQQGEYGIGFFLPIVSLICNTLANWSIRRDEKLVRDADKLR